MRFFSNDARETPDDEETPGGRPERVKSEPVAVPVQRPAASPWAANPAPATPAPATPAPATPAPATPDRDADRDAGRLGDAPSAGPVAGRPPFHEPAPQPTAFGAGTVGGAVAASALANPVNDTRTDADRRTDAASGVADDRTVAPGGPGVDAAPRDGGTFAGPVVAERTGDGPPPPSAFGSPSDSRTDQGLSTARTEAAFPQSDVDRNDTAGAAPVVAVAGGQDTQVRPDRDRATSTDADLTEPDRTDTDRADTPWADTDRAETNVADTDLADTDRADTDRADLDGSVRDTTTPAGPDPTVVAADEQPPASSRDGDLAGKLPGTVAAPELGPLFADRDAHAFRDQWRDVQLRFVDDPKAAADEAAGLVEEVMEALSAGLRRQREQIVGDTAGQDSGDTEQLRVRLRSYRDFLDHLLSL